LEERESLQSRVDSLEIALRTARLDFGGDGDRGRDEALLHQRHTQRLSDEKLALAEKNACLEGRNKQLNTELEHQRRRVTDAEQATSKLSESLQEHMARSHELQIGKERLELMLEFKEKDVAKVVVDIQTNRAQCAEAIKEAHMEGEEKNRILMREVQVLKATAEKATRKQKDALEARDKEKRRAKRKDEAMLELHDEVNALKEEKRKLDSVRISMESEFKREQRELLRKVDMAQARQPMHGAMGASASRGGAATGTDTARNLREAFKKENDVLKELANMSENLSRQGYN